jgi:hypothetical protein
MQRKRYIVGATTIVGAALSLAVWLSAASAGGGTVINFTMSEHGTYSCLGPCATAADFTASGIANSDSKVLGTMADKTIGHVDSGPDANNCLTQTEEWSFTTQGHKGQDSFVAHTVGDTFCFNADFSVATETADFVIDGGTGRFLNASGSGHFTLTVLSHPQTGSGTITGTLNLP